MKCPICGDEFESRRSDAQTCQKPACRKKFQRLKLKNQLPVTPELKEKIEAIPLQKVATPKGHWVGKAPHRAIWSACAADNCPHKDAPEPDWEVTCGKVCCTIKP